MLTMQDFSEEDDSEDSSKVYSSQTLDEMDQSTEVTVLEDEVLAICTTPEAFILIEDHLCCYYESQCQYHTPDSIVHEPVGSLIERLRLSPSSSPSLVNMGLCEVFEFYVKLVLNLGKDHYYDK